MAIRYCEYTSGNDTTGDGSIGTPYKTLQKCIDVSTGGDTIRIANTSTQIISATITWNTGFTIANTVPTTIEPYDAGGAITIKRPDEALARVAAEIDGNGNTYIFSTNTPENIFFKNISLKNSGNDKNLINSATNWNYYGCKFSNFGVTGSASGTILNQSASTFINNYFINDANATGYFLGFGGASATSTLVLNNYFEINQIGWGNITFGFNMGGWIRGNIFNASNLSTNDIIIDINNNYVQVEGNTFIGKSGQQMTAINANAQASVFNNLFYNFNHASSKTIANPGAIKLKVVGNNAFYNSNAMDSFDRITMDLTANDIIGTGSPFNDLENFNFAVDRTSAKNAGLGNP